MESGWLRRCRYDTLGLSMLLESCTTACMSRHCCLCALHTLLLQGGRALHPLLQITVIRSAKVLR
jgi:hypothetical protein